MSNMPAKPQQPHSSSQDAQPPATPKAQRRKRSSTQPASGQQSASNQQKGSKKQKGSSVYQEMDVLIRARYPILYVVSWEEERVEQCLRTIASSRDKKLFTWTITQGILKSGSEIGNSKSGSGNTSDPLAALDAVVNQVDPAIYLFKDFHHFTDDQRCNLSVIRRLRDVAYHLRDTYKTIVITSPLLKIAPELSKDVTLLEFDLPNPKDFGRLLERIIDDVRDNPKVTISLDADSKEHLLRAARGLTLKEAENVFAKTLVKDGRLDSSDVSIVFSEKQQIIKKSGLLEYYASQEKLSNVAGLGNLKGWLSKRSIAFTDSARRFGLPAPRGILLLGPDQAKAKP